MTSHDARKRGVSPFSWAIAIVLALVVLVVGATSESHARTWHNKDGRTIEADFVALNGSILVLKKGGKEVRVELSKLTDQDQAVAKGLAAMMSSASSSVRPKPATVSDNPFEAAEEIDVDEDANDEENSKPGKPKPFKPSAKPKSKDEKSGEKTPAISDAMRPWADRLGNKTYGRFLAISGSVVTVERRDKHKVTFDYFSLVDRDRSFVDGALTKAGYAELIPSRPGAGGAVAASPSPAMPTPGGFGAPPSAMPGAGGMYGSSVPGMPNTPAMPAMPTPTMPPPTMPTPSMPAMPGSGMPGSYGSTPGYSGMPGGVPSPSMPGGYAGVPPRVSRFDNPSYGGDGSNIPRLPPELPTYTPPTYTPPTYTPPTYTSITQKQCMRCQRVVSSSLSAGDKCPYCGVVFAYDETNGRRATGVAGAGAAVIGVIVFVLIAGVSAVVMLVVFLAKIAHGAVEPPRPDNYRY